MKKITLALIVITILNSNALAQDTNTNTTNSKKFFFNNTGIFITVRGMSNIPITGNLKESSSLGIGGGIETRRGDNVFFYTQAGVLGSLIYWPTKQPYMVPVSVFNKSLVFSEWYRLLRDNSLIAFFDRGDSFFR